MVNAFNVLEKKKKEKKQNQDSQLDWNEPSCQESSVNEWFARLVQKLIKKKKF